MALAVCYNERQDLCGRGHPAFVLKDNRRQSQWRKRLRVRTKKELPDRLKLRSANQTKNIEEFFSMTEKDINSLEDTKWRCQYHIGSFEGR